MTREEKFMQEAIKLAEKGMESNEGGPFGCIIVKNGKIIGRGNNKVLINKDPTAHAEMVAIKDACKTLGSLSLDGCEIYTSGEPCPMCMAAIYWARPKAVFYAAACSDAAHIGFDDQVIYSELAKPSNHRSIPMTNIDREAALKLFDRWKNKADKTMY